VTSAAELRQLARAVERLCCTGRLDPEAVYLVKAEIARRIRAVARVLEQAR
jgi:hypothetical protein